MQNQRCCPVDFVHVRWFSATCLGDESHVKKYWGALEKRLKPSVSKSQLPSLKLRSWDFSLMISWRADRKMLRPARSQTSGPIS